jgi:putative transposase
MQQALTFRSWGGRRRGAGRKPGPGRSRVGHGLRPSLGKTTPVHVTMRFVRGLPNLRSQVTLAAFKRSLRIASKDDVRVTTFSLQRDHAHLIVEAPDKGRLARAMRGLASGFARKLNTILRRRGRVVADRYHRHDLKTPREVRHALVYVKQNAKKHEPALRS